MSLHNWLLNWRRDRACRVLARERAGRCGHYDYEVDFADGVSASGLGVDTVEGCDRPGCDTNRECLADALYQHQCFVLGVDP